MRVGTDDIKYFVHDVFSYSTQPVLLYTFRYRVSKLHSLKEVRLHMHYIPDKLQTHEKSGLIESFIKLVFPFPCYITLPLTVGIRYKYRLTATSSS